LFSRRRIDEVWHPAARRSVCENAPMDLGIAGRVALVTASSKGLGRASALALAQEGCKLVICARGEEALAATAEDIEATGAEVLAIVDDVTEPDAPARLVASTVEHFGSIDILVGNAGGPPPGRALDVTDEGIAAAVNANLTTSVRLAREAVPHLREKGWGRICFITSASVKQPIPTLALSNTARTGLWAWAKTAAQDLIAAGITVNLACPGSHDTDRIRALVASGAMSDQLIGDPADFGKVVAFLCSEPAKFVSGTAVQVDGARVLGLL
jgi:3-oxoacyl-[acyl-carrier protein] reductase